MKNIKTFIFSAILFLFGILLYFFPVLFINKGLMPGDLGDARFINYILEHIFLYINANPLHHSFWDMPFYYPYSNTLAYSDVMLGAALLYVPVRFFTDNPQAALQIWLFLVCLLNYLSAFILFKNTFKFSAQASSLGAFLFAFSLPRYAQIYHLQLYTQFFMVFSLIAFLSLKKTNSKLKNKNNLLFASGSFLFVLQFYTSFYFGWFMVFCFIVLFLILIFQKNSRNNIKDFILFYKKELIAYCVFSFILILPLLWHYLQVGVQFPYTDWRLLNLKYFFFSQSWLDYIMTNSKNPFNCEFFIGIGYFATIAFFVGLYVNKYRKNISIFLISLLFILSVDILSHGLYYLIPGASAIRVNSRIIFILLLLYSYVICGLLDGIKNKFILFSVILIVTLEQIPYNLNFEWTRGEHIRRINMYEVPKECRVVLYYIEAKPDWAYKLDIMWMASNKGIYTSNGYSGFSPDIDDNFVPDNCRFIIEGIKNRL